MATRLPHMQTCEAWGHRLTREGPNRPRHGLGLTVLVTEITLANGDRLRVEGTTEDVGAAILAAARGSLMQFAWLTDADSGQSVGITPEHVLMLRVFDPDAARE